MQFKVTRRHLKRKLSLKYFSHPEARERREGRSPAETPAGDRADWDFATVELYEKQGIDLRVEMQREMERQLKALEAQFMKEKQEADRVFEQERKVGNILHFQIHLSKLSFFLFRISEILSFVDI